MLMPRLSTVPQQDTGLGAYLSVEADAIYDVGLPSPLMALTNEVDLGRSSQRSDV